MSRRVITDVVALGGDDALAAGQLAGVEVTVRDDGRREVWLVGVGAMSGMVTATPDMPALTRCYSAETHAHALALALEDVLNYGLCPECSGTGRVEQPRVPLGSLSIADPADVVTVDCEACGGTGRAS